MKEKLITIDYEEYLELEKCKGVIEDLRENIRNAKRADQCIATQTQHVYVDMPNSLMYMIRHDLKFDRVDGITLCVSNKPNRGDHYNEI